MDSDHSSMGSKSFKYSNQMTIVPNHSRALKKSNHSTLELERY